MPKQKYFSKSCHYLVTMTTSTKVLGNTVVYCWSLRIISPSYIGLPYLVFL